LRAPTERELDYVTSKLSEEAIVARRESVIREKDVELKSVVDGHDDAVREKFHLERFISIFEGWDPAVSPLEASLCKKLNRQVAKQDNSPVFLEVSLTIRLN
jgi:helicase SWR1